MSEPDVLERGDVFFFYRPKVETEHASGLDDVQRFFVVLKPDGKEKYRRIVVGQKYLSNIHENERNWAFVDMVAHSADKLDADLDPRQYETKTRGERHLPAARPVGEGRYAIVRHDNHTHLAYALELPRKTGPAQHDLQIEDEASYVISVKNPNVGGTPNAGLPERDKPKYPKRLMERFGDNRWTDLDPPDFLDHEGTELVIIGARHDISKELDLRLQTKRESKESAETFTELGIKEEKHPIGPLMEGDWK